MRTEKNKLKMNPNKGKHLNYKIKKLYANKDVGGFEPFRGSLGNTYVAVNVLKAQRAKL